MPMPRYRLALRRRPASSLYDLDASAFGSSTASCFAVGDDDDDDDDDDDT